jgi:hypothetical protein
VEVRHSGKRQKQESKGRQSNLDSRVRGNDRVVAGRIKKPASLLAQRAHVEDLVKWSGGPLLCVARSYP